MKKYDGLKNKYFSFELIDFQIKSEQYYKKCLEKFGNLEGSMYFASYDKYLIMVIQPVIPYKKHIYNFKENEEHNFNNVTFSIDNYKTILFFNKFNPDETFNVDDVIQNTDVKLGNFCANIEVAFYNQLDMLATMYSITNNSYKQWNTNGLVTLDIKN